MAREQLAASGPPLCFEDLFWRSAVATLASGSIVDPDLATLHASLRSAGTLGALSAQAGFQAGRVAHLMDFTLLAIAHLDLDVLDTMQAIWRGGGDVADEWCAGWIDLFVHGTVLDEEVIGFLIEDRMIDLKSAADRAWLALHARQPEAARLELETLEEDLADCWRVWEEQPDVALLYALRGPGMILAVQQRAIAAVLTRWHTG